MPVVYDWSSFKWDWRAEARWDEQAQESWNENEDPSTRALAIKVEEDEDGASIFMYMPALISVE
eukprot:5172089-Amphidinium_carterae.1